MDARDGAAGTRLHRRCKLQIRCPELIFGWRSRKTRRLRTHRSFIARPSNSRRFDSGRLHAAIACGIERLPHWVRARC